MATLKNKKTYPFRSFQGVSPTTEELREEMERMYKYLREEVDEVISEDSSECSFHDEVLCADSEVIFAGGDAIMVTCIPNS